MGNCGVCIGGYDLDGSLDFCSVVHRKARKTHRCVECRKAISIGETYVYAASKYDGDFSATKTCLTCSEINTMFSCGGGVIIGEMWSEMKDYVFPGLTTANECFQKLSPLSKTKVLGEWKRWKGLV